MAVIEGRGEPTTREVYCSPEMGTLNDGGIVVSANPDNPDVPDTLKQAVLHVRNGAGRMVIVHLTVEMVEALRDALAAAVA